MDGWNIPKWWQQGICKFKRKQEENIHINIDNTIKGGENARSGENTHTYPIALSRFASRLSRPVLPHFPLCHCVLYLQPFIRCLSSCATKLSTSKAVTDKPVSHYDTGSGWCVPLLYRPICQLHCYLEAASS